MTINTLGPSDPDFRMNGHTIKEAQNELRYAKYIDPKQSLSKLLNSDNLRAEKLGTTHEEIATILKNLFSQVTIESTRKSVNVAGKYTFSDLEDYPQRNGVILDLYLHAWQDPERNPLLGKGNPDNLDENWSVDLIVTNRETKDSIKISPGVIQYIEKYGFYEGCSEYRIRPYFLACILTGRKYMTYLDFKKIQLEKADTAEEIEDILKEFIQVTPSKNGYREEQFLSELTMSLNKLDTSLTSFSITFLQKLTVSNDLETSEKLLMFLQKHAGSATNAIRSEDEKLVDKFIATSDFVNLRNFCKIVHLLSQNQIFYSLKEKTIARVNDLLKSGDFDEITQLFLCGSGLVSYNNQMLDTILSEMVEKGHAQQAVDIVLNVANPSCKFSFSKVLIAHGEAALSAKLTPKQSLTTIQQAELHLEANEITEIVQLYQTINKRDYYEMMLMSHLLAKMVEKGYAPQAVAIALNVGDSSSIETLIGKLMLHKENALASNLLKEMTGNMTLRIRIRYPSLFPAELIPEKEQPSLTTIQQAKQLLDANIADEIIQLFPTKILDYSEIIPVNQLLAEMVEKGHASQAMAIMLNVGDDAAKETFIEKLMSHNENALAYNIVITIGCTYTLGRLKARFPSLFAAEFTSITKLVKSIFT